MQRHFSQLALATGFLAVIGVGVWNAVEVRQLRERLKGKPTEPTVAAPPVTETPTHPPVTIAPPDVLRIDVKADGTLPLTPVRGEHLIRSDGTVSLGQYGSVYVAGMTLPMVKATLTEHLKKYFTEVTVGVEVSACNSRAFYVISDFGGSGESVVRCPASGYETVFDAVAKVGGFTGGERKVWVTRRGRGEADEILPVDWNGITARGHTRTNYQLLPDDRVYVKKAD